MLYSFWRHSYLTIVLMTLLLVSFAKIASCFTPKFPSASASEGRDIEACVNACQNFRGGLFRFCSNMNKDTWAAAKSDFSTCQYRCYKCTMKGAITAMDYIETQSNNFDDMQTKQMILTFQQIQIIESYQLCRDKWVLAAAFNCNKTPAEDAIDSKTKKCL